MVVNGNFSLENDLRGRPEENSIDNSVLRKIITNNPIQTVTEIVFQLKVSHSTIICDLAQTGNKENGLTDLMEIAISLFQRNKKTPFLKRFFLYRNDKQKHS